nr:uncharacterized protein LOC109784521 [Aegilops tauschii subsp. strangulata]
MVLEDESSDDNSSLPYMHSETSTDGLNQVPFFLEDPDYKGLELDLIVLCEKHGKPSERLVAFEGTMTGRRFLACAEPDYIKLFYNVLLLLSTWLCKFSEGQNCGFVQWVDEQWPPTMENALLKLWSMVEESKSARVNDNLQSALTIHHLAEEKNKLDADYDKAELVAGMNAEMAKKDAATEKLQQKYELLCNLTSGIFPTTSAQATVIQNLKLKTMKEKELMSEARMNLELKNAEFTKFEEKLTQEKLELKFQVADLLKLKENHNDEKQMQEFKITELMKAEEKLKQKIKGIQAIL